MNAHPRPYYYLENFQVALEWLRGRYADLLSCEERQFIADLARLPIESAALVVRMIMRQGDLFRTSKLHYSEIGCPLRAAAPLIELRWLDPDPLLSFPDLFRLLRKAEVCDALRLPRATRSLRKPELIPLAEEVIGATQPLQVWWPNAPDVIFQVRIASLCDRLRLMFFGNFRQTWSEFVLADLGIFRYESISLEPSARAFQTRGQIEQFCAIHRCRELLHAEAPLEEVLAHVPAPLTGGDHAPWIEAKRAKLLFAIAQLYEKDHDLSRALEVYQRSHHPEARIRTIRVLEKLDRLHEAAQLLALVQQQPATEWETQLGARILPRLSRKLTGPQSDSAAHRRKSLPARTTRHGWSVLELELPQPDPPQRVELVVSAHLCTPEAPVLYVENTLLNALFGLLCWDALFAPLPGAFFHPFHAAPADLLEADFQERRATQFATCFAQLESGAYRDTILATFERKSGLQTPFVAWDWLTREQLELALDCIPATHLHGFFRRLLTDVRANRSGLPDLIQLWPGERRYRLIEVKGPGDRLQDNQIRWLSFCVAREIPVCVCKVRWRV
ncbi:MAG TPA: VRR-NUC domain-containing protein [Steroidobacteraceae bacterium]